MDDQRGAVRQLLGAVVAEGDSGGRWIVEVRQVVRVEDHAPLVGPGVTHRGRPGGGDFPRNRLRNHYGAHVRGACSPESASPLASATRTARFTAETTARSDAVVIDGAIPHPHTVSPRT